MLRSTLLILCVLFSFSAIAEEDTCTSHTTYSDEENQRCCDDKSFSANMHACCNSENIVRNIGVCCTQENFEKGNPFGCCTHIPELRSASHETPWLDQNIGLCAVFCTDPTFRNAFSALCTKANTVSGGKLYNAKSKK